MSTKKSNPKKSQKKVAKKAVKKKAVKKNVKKKSTNKKVARSTPTVGVMPKELLVFTEVVTDLVAAVNNVIEILNNNIFPKSDALLNEIKTSNEQTDLFPKEDAPVQGSEFTQEDVTQALQQVSTVHGLDRVKVVLNKFKAEKISDIYVEPNIFRKFIEHCNKVSAEKA